MSPALTKSCISLVTEVPGPKSRELMARREAAIPPGPFHVTKIFAKKAHGAIIEDVDGNQLLDFTSGIGVTNTGHAAEAVVDAIKEQSSKFLHTSFNVVPYAGYVEVAERLNKLVPGPWPKKTFLVNSGSEAVENAIKFARSYTKRPAIIAFDHAYHGRTYMAMSLTAKAHPYKHGFAPFNSDIYRAPFPDIYHAKPTDSACCNDETCDVETGDCTCAQAFEKFRELAEGQIGSDQIAAVIIEPQTGEGGFMPVPKPFLQTLAKYCRAQGIVFILDEIQTGFGRTGKLFACEHSGVDPDLIILAKGLAGGLPLSAVTGKAEILDAVPIGGVGGTYSGNPVACAAALAVMDQFQDGTLLAHANRLGDIVEEHFQRWHKRFQKIGDTRGLGPMKGMELVTDRTTKKPDKAATGKLLAYAHARGLILMSAGTHGNVIRLLFPLVTTEAQLKEGLAIIEAGLESIHDA